MTARLTIQDLSSPPDGDFRFGLHSKEHTVAGLRKLADLVDQGHLVLQQITLEQDAKLDDFLMHTMTIRYVEREPKK